MGQIDEDAKYIKQLVEDFEPQSIMVSPDGTIHSHSTNSLAWLRNKSKTSGPEGMGWAAKYQAERTVWEKKSGKTYIGSDGETTKDIDISTVVG